MFLVTPGLANHLRWLLCFEEEREPRPEVIDDLDAFDVMKETLPGLEAELKTERRKR